ncbi:MAG: AAA family ATPase [Bacteroidales bacterium]|nr:AAA family ATPase [Bacteroidales bacterium]
MDMSSVIGREEELSTISRLYESERSEFLAIYGRRRVGKSFLIEEALGDKISFMAVGIYQKIDKDNVEKVDSYRQKQLAHFYNSLLEYGLPKASNPAPASWMDAFELLKKLLQRKRSRRKVVFIDELPWLAGPQSSELLEELGHFWNSWARKRKDIFLIVCGSATSWMVDNVLRDYGGLYGRITESIFLKPFTLEECERYWTKRGFHLSRYEIALTYMVIGGVPYYMDSIRPDRTMADNINAIYFDKDKARQEFKDVYTGLYSSSETYINVIRELGKRFYGMTRDELLKAVDKKGGGSFTGVLENLIDSGIIRSYTLFGGPRKQTVYQLVDFFTLFYLRFVENSDFTSWRSVQRSKPFYAWAGNTFELLVIQHMPQLANALRIKEYTTPFSWRGETPDGEGVQVDLIIPATAERADYICEMKFSEGKYTLTNNDVEEITRQISAVSNSKIHKPSHSIYVALITSFGTTESKHKIHVNDIVTLNSLF